MTEGVTLDYRPAANLLVKVGGYSYQWLDPVGSSFVVGRNLPVKFTVRGPDGSFVLDRSVLVDVVDASGVVMAGRPSSFGNASGRHAAPSPPLACDLRTTVLGTPLGKALRNAPPACHAVRWLASWRDLLRGHSRSLAHGGALFPMSAARTFVTQQFL